MGDRYEFYKECPNCGKIVRCYYAESCEATNVTCLNCKKKFNIVMEFKLVEEI